MEARVHWVSCRHPFDFPGVWQQQQTPNLSVAYVDSCPWGEGQHQGGHAMQTPQLGFADPTAWVCPFMFVVDQIGSWWLGFPKKTPSLICCSQDERGTWAILWSCWPRAESVRGQSQVSASDQLAQVRLVIPCLQNSVWGPRISACESSSSHLLITQIADFSECRYMLICFIIIWVWQGKRSGDNCHWKDSLLLAVPRLRGGMCHAMCGPRGKYQGQSGGRGQNCGEEHFLWFLQKITSETG